MLENRLRQSSFIFNKIRSGIDFCAEYEYCIGFKK